MSLSTKWWLLCVLIATAAHAQSLPLSPQAQVGRAMFFDTQLSASKQMSCATCHDPSNHYGQSNDLPVQMGGRKRATAGFRAVPTLTYTQYVPVYSDDALNPDGVSTNGPGGGFSWDGHANTIAEQVVQPLLASHEMANASPAAVVRVVEESGYASLFVQAYGPDVFDDSAAAFKKIALALQAFEQEDASFHPYTSKYDLYSHNKIGGDFTMAELRGLAVFTNGERGNCEACHYSGPMLGGGEHQFTDYSFQALGVPRNSNIPANAGRSGKYYDLGACTAQNPKAPHALPASGNLCGLFRTPTLRNVATRKVFFHNGSLHTLKDVIHFYNTRDTQPELWYPVVHGKVKKFDDLPVVYRANLDTKDVPFEGLPVGGTPHMTAQDEHDLECFLNTLTDGYVPGSPPADPTCVN